MDYDLNIFWWRQALGYSDIIYSLPTENKLWHHPILMTCMSDVNGVNVLLRKLVRFLRMEKA